MMTNFRPVRWKLGTLFLFTFFYIQAQSQLSTSNFDEMSTVLSEGRPFEKMSLSSSLQYLENLSIDPDSMIYSIKEREKRNIFYQLKAALVFGPTSDESPFIGADVVNGISFYDFAMVGVGAGLRFPFNREVIAAPLFLDLRLTFTQNQVNPFLELGWGGTFQPNSNYENSGQFYQAQAGVIIRGKSRLSYLVSMGYESFDIKYKENTRSLTGSYYNSYQRDAEKETISSISVNFGLIF